MDEITCYGVDTGLFEGGEGVAVRVLKNVGDSRDSKTVT